jgi:putative transposon-encoded protein
MPQLKLKGKKLSLTDEILGFFEKRVTKFGNGAKIDCPKEFLGKRVYVVICEK